MTRSASPIVFEQSAPSAARVAPLVRSRFRALTQSPLRAALLRHFHTQPEFSFFFDDVGWNVENYGTDPDIEVDNRPQDYVRGVDVQLNRAIEVCLAQFTVRPPHTPQRKEHRQVVPPPLTPRQRR